MAEENDPTAVQPQGDTTPARRVRNRPAAKRADAVATRPAKAPRAKKSVRKPLKSLVILSVVGGLVVTVALPAYAASRGADVEAAQTIQQFSADDAQSMVIASDAVSTELTREGYAATTEAEIATKKAAEAAAARARQSARVAGALVNINLVSPGTGEVRWPILNFTKGRGLWDSGYHQGVDLLAPAGTPIYAAAAGVVKTSQESFGGYGVAVTIEHVIGGQRVSTLYGHMTYGSRQVVSGQTVEAGQLIGLVGSTGSSSANHLHFEVHINGSVVDPWAWLQSNAG
ncbi:M23 family metallopeptidase [Microbacterium sp.]|uniref:M23 family metallopeptidase n=1 Tax=Microbacterium sp. TaxID=51671 RepID=UPI003F711049